MFVQVVMHFWKKKKMARKRGKGRKEKKKGESKKEMKDKRGKGGKERRERKGARTEGRK